MYWCIDGLRKITIRRDNAVEQHNSSKRQTKEHILFTNQTNEYKISLTNITVNKVLSWVTVEKMQNQVFKMITF